MVLANASGQPCRTADFIVEEDIVEALRCSDWLGLLSFYRPFNTVNLTDDLSRTVADIVIERSDF